MATAKITLNNFGGGINSDFAKGAASALPTRSNTYYMGLCSVNNPNYIGQLSDAAGSDPSAVFSNGGIGINATIASNNLAYFITQQGFISTFDTTLSFPPTPITHGSPVGVVHNKYKDIWNHVSSTGVESIFYTYETATNVYLGIGNINNFTFRNDTSYNITPTRLGVPHVGVKSVGNRSYITNGEYIMSYDPNSPATLGSVNCGKGFTLVSIADYGNYVAAIGNNGTTSRMFLWDGVSQDPDFQYEIRDTRATAIVNEGGTLRVFTQGKNDTTKIKTFDGSGFSEDADWEIPTSICEAPEHNMTDVFMNQIVWKRPTGQLWSYGSPRRNEITTGAHQWGVCETSPTVTNLGFVKNLTGSNLYIASTDATNQEKVFRVKLNNYQALSSSNFRTNLIELPHLSTIERITLYFSKYSVPTTSSTGSACRVSLFKNYSTTDLLNYSIPNQGAAPSNIDIEYYPINKKIPQVDSFYLDINFTSATIRKIVIKYSYEEDVV